MSLFCFFHCYIASTYLSIWKLKWINGDILLVCFFFFFSSVPVFYLFETLFMGMFWSVLKLAPVIHSLLSGANLLTLRRCLHYIQYVGGIRMKTWYLLCFWNIPLFWDIYIYIIKKVLCVIGYVCEKQWQQQQKFKN